jgi:type II secretory pathway pseudopilin PulG
MRLRALARAGFSFLEILIALGILGTAVVVVIGHVNHAVAMYRVARETVVATSLAQARLSAIVGSREPLRERRDKGTVKEDPRFAYSERIEEFSLPAPGLEKDDLKGILRAEVVIHWESGARRQVRLVQLVSSEGAP